MKSSAIVLLLAVEWVQRDYANPLHVERLPRPLRWSLYYAFLAILFLFGLPIFLVLIVGSMLMGLVGMVLSIGLAAVKIGLFVVLPIWLMWTLAGKIWHWGKKKDGGDSSATDSTPPNSGPTTGPVNDGASEL